MIAEDTRIPALATDASEYEFNLPAAGDVVIQTELLFRRAFEDLATWKGWDDPDIIMAQNRVTIPAP